MNLATFIRLIFCCILVTSCRQNTTNITFHDIDCYKGTAIENFAKLVEREDTTQMKMYIHKMNENASLFYNYMKYILIKCIADSKIIYENIH